MSPARSPAHQAGADKRQAVRLLRTILAGRSAEAMGGGTSGGLVDSLMRHDLLARDAGNGLSVTDSGLAWLRRSLLQGDVYAEQHRLTARRSLDGGDGTRLSVTVDLAESPLAWLARRRRRDGRCWIDAAQLAAGERLRADYTRGQLLPRTTSDWSRSVDHGRKRSGTGGGLAMLSDAALDARDRVRRALMAAGPDLSDLLVEVCCELRGLEAVEKARGWPARSAKVLLGVALRRLADHYGLAETAQGRGSAMRRWGSDDYRPKLSG